ncbi:hypothetical protein VTO73DRAFT_4634 [Trametes versicolor]
MSSPDEDGPSDARAGASKRRKVLQRACDYCRRKKIKCDGPRMPNKRCSKCISRRTECTYVEPFNKPRYPDSYVENLESRLQRMEELLNRLNPDGDVLKTLDHGSENAPSPSAASTSSLRVPHLALTPSSPEAGGDEDDFSDHDEIMRKELINGMSRLSLQPTSLRYHGKSSGWVFIQATEGFRQEYLRDAVPTSTEAETSFLRNSGKKYDRQPWLERPLQQRLLEPECFPPTDLMNTLVENYFRLWNDYTPLLHEPTFLRNIKDKLHLRVPGFGATVLLACALGARHSDDRRVLLELDNTDSWQSAGWKYFQRVDDMHKSHLAPIHVYDIQICAMSVIYMQTTTLPHCSWIIIGLGLRQSMDVGAHRKSMYKPKPTVEDELWRRAFWLLLVYEWGGSYGLGRPPCIHEEEYDVAFPTECDDEFWENDDPEKAFVQPADMPSKTAFWNCYIRLFKVIAYATRTIFSIRKSRAQMVNGDQQWEDRIVAELDSELNRWADTVPEHLKWDPNCKNELWLGQSATLFGLYYQVQVTVHRSFITSRRGSPHSLASLIICTNAARSCVQVLYELYLRIGTPLPRNSGPVFNAGLVLLISMWGQRRSGRHAGADRDEEYIRKCLQMLESIEKHNNVAERLKDMLLNFMSVEVPKKQPSESRPGEEANKADRRADPAASPSSTQGDDGGDRMSRPEESGAGLYATPESLSSPSTGLSSQPTSPDAASPGLTNSFLNAPMFGFSPPQSQGFPRLPQDPLGGSFLSDWQQQTRPQQPSPSAQSMPGFNFAPLDPSAPAWGSSGRSGQGQSFGAAGQSMASGSQQNNAAPYPSYGTFGLVDSGGAYPMDMSDFQGAQGAETGSTDFGFPDCAFVDDTMTMWATAPASFGWQDWESYFNTVNTQQSPPAN